MLAYERENISLTNHLKYYIISVDILYLGNREGENMKSKHTVAMFFATLAVIMGAFFTIIAKTRAELLNAGTARTMGIILIVAGVLYLIFALFSFDELHSVGKNGQKTAKKLSLVTVILAIIAQVAIRMMYGVESTSLYTELLFAEKEIPLIPVLVCMLLSAIGAFSVYLWCIDMLEMPHDSFYQSAQANGTESGRNRGFTVYKWELFPICVMCALLGAFCSHVLLLFVLLGFILYSIIPVRRSAVFAFCGSCLVGVMLFICTFGATDTQTYIFPEMLEIMPIVLIAPIIVLMYLHTNGKVFTGGVIAVSTIGLLVSLVLGFILGGMLDEKIMPERYERDYILPIGVVLVVALAILLVVFSIRAYVAKSKMQGKRFGDKIALSVVSPILACAMLVPSASLVIRGDMNIFNGREKLPPPVIEYTLVEDAYLINEGVRYDLSNKGYIATEVVDRSLTQINVVGYDRRVDEPEEISPKAQEIIDSAVQRGEGVYNENVVYAIAGGFLTDNSSVEKLVLGYEYERDYRYYRTTMYYIEDGAVENCENLTHIELWFNFADNFAGASLSKKALSLERGARIYPMALNNTQRYYIAYEPYQNKMYYLHDVSLELSSQIYTFLTGGLKDDEAQDVHGSFDYKGEVFGKKVELSYYQDNKWEIRHVNIASAGDNVKCPAGRSTMTISFSAGGSFLIEKSVLGIKYNETAEFSCSETLTAYTAYEFSGSETLRLKNPNKHSGYFSGDVMIGLHLYYDKD